MTDSRCEEFDPRLLELYSYWLNGFITKRIFLEQAQKYAISEDTASMLLDLLAPGSSAAQQVSIVESERASPV